jgi:hypothetical protein
VLLRAGLVEQPKVTFAKRAVEGGRDKMRVDDRTITITNQPGLNPNRRNWRGGLPEMRLPSDVPADGSQPIFAPVPNGYAPIGSALPSTPLNDRGPIRLTP